VKKYFTSTSRKYFLPSWSFQGT